MEFSRLARALPSPMRLERRQISGANRAVLLSIKSVRGVQRQPRLAARSIDNIRYCGHKRTNFSMRHDDFHLGCYDLRKPGKLGRGDQRHSLAEAHCAGRGLGRLALVISHSALA
jgi:hypothetical protein